MIFDGSCITSIARKQSTCYDDIKMFLRFQVCFSYSVFSLFLVIEIDMPWKDNCEDKYGDSFRPWTEDDLQQAIGNIIAALPHNHCTFYFPYSSFLGLSFTRTEGVRT